MSAIAPPTSYASLPFKDISISHVPESSPTPTKVVVVYLNRPSKFNAATATMVQELETAFNTFKIDDRVKAIVITGKGPAFCAGADLTVGFSSLLATAKDPTKARAYRDGGGRVTLSIHNCSKPTIVALNGPAAGFGITLTLPATIRVACSSAKISFAFARRGLTMEACSAYFLPRLIGVSRTLQLTTTGSTYKASDPVLSQLFSEILPTPEETVSRALELAGDIAANTSTVSTAVMRDMVYRGPETAEEAHLLDSRIFLGMLRSRDSEEGVKSFFEKRSPEFRGTMEGDAPGVWPWWEKVETRSVEREEEGKAKL
ncbi:hypothetical protein FQN54_003044 [Arachnomyces sp. PD_36]|nr:hypothetical protein FQN54_003044 [Arachnomyces sp. PD_36]